MKEQDAWVYWKDIDWSDRENNVFSIDTRDFHCGYRWDNKPHPDYDTLKNYGDRFFLTKEELLLFIERIYNESGGGVKWRYLALESRDNRVSNWYMKYLRIYRTALGFIVCNSNSIAIPKDILELPVEQRYLNAH